MAVRRLVVLRHAKSDWTDDVSDDRRPLAARGRRQAAAAAAGLARYAPTVALTSPALRCLQTLDVLAGEGFVVPHTTIAGLYDGSVDPALAAIRRLPATVTAALVVTHFPTVAGLVEECAAPDGTALWARLRTKFPTSAFAVVEFEGTWADAGTARGTLIAFETPRG